MGRCREWREARDGQPIKHAAGDGATDFFQSAYFGTGQAKSGEAVGSRLYQALWGERIVGCGKPSPDRTGARRRKLLRDHDAGYSGKSAGPPAQWQRAGDRRHGGKSRISRNQDVKPCSDVGLGVYTAVHLVAAREGVGHRQDSGRPVIYQPGHGQPRKLPPTGMPK